MERMERQIENILWISNFLVYFIYINNRGVNLGLFVSETGKIIIIIVIIIAVLGKICANIGKIKENENYKLYKKIGAYYCGISAMQLIVFTDFNSIEIIHMAFIFVLLTVGIYINGKFARVLLITIFCVNAVLAISCEVFGVSHHSIKVGYHFSNFIIAFICVIFCSILKDFMSLYILGEK